MKHGHARDGARTPEYRSWCLMIERCERQSNKRYSHYGGRGIRVCEQWRSSFMAFLSDVGARPTLHHSLDRVDVNGHYEPGNVRWATAKEQNRNRSNNRLVTFRGETLPLAAWAEMMRLPQNVLRWRLARGWSVDDAMTRPVRSQTPHAPAIRAAEGDE